MKAPFTFVAAACILIGLTTTALAERNQQSAPADRGSWAVRLTELAKLPVRSFKWRRINGVLFTDFVIQNLADYPVVNITVLCTTMVQTTNSYLVESKTYTVTQPVEANGTIELANVEMGPVKSEAAPDCHVIDSRRAE